MLGTKDTGMSKTAKHSNTLESWKKYFAIVHIEKIENL